MFSVTLLRWITLGSVLFWLARYWQGGKKAITDIQNSLLSKNSRIDAILLIVITLCSAGIVGTGILVCLKLSPTVLSQNLVIIFTGTLLSVFGIMGMFYCRHHLGKYWTAETNLSHNHQLIDTGPYRFVRHPIYTFAIMMYTGLGMVFPWQWNVVLVCVIVMAYILKAKDEDHYLEQNLTGYREYKGRVRHLLVPGLW